MLYTDATGDVFDHDNLDIAEVRLWNDTTHLHVAISVVGNLYVEDWSHFMVFIPSLGLSDKPPESNVTPLPTKANGASPGLPPLWPMMTKRGGRTEPWATASSAPQRSDSSFC